MDGLTVVEPHRAVVDAAEQTLPLNSYHVITVSFF